MIRTTTVCLLGRVRIAATGPRRCRLVNSLGLRLIHGCSIRNVMNPLLPFDIVEEVQTEELEEANKKLEKDKKKLIKEKKKIKKARGKNGEKPLDAKERKRSYDSNKLTEEDYQTAMDTIPLKKALSSELREVDVRDTKTAGGSVHGTKDGDTTKHDKFGDEIDETKLAGNSGKDYGKKGSDGDERGDADKVKSAKDEEAERTFNFKGKESSETADQAHDNQSVDDSPQRQGNGGDDGDGGKKHDGMEEKESDFEENEEPEEKPPSKVKEALSKLGRFLFKCLETVGITFSSIAILGVAGLMYHKLYSEHVLDKIDEAFNHGDPAYQLAIHKRTSKHSVVDDSDYCNESDLSLYWVERPQQKLLNDIVSGRITGRYFLLVGEKGTGKTSLIMEAIKYVNGYNVAVFDAHADPEIFRIRLGRVLNYAFAEDYIGALFSMRGPRDTTALLDIERAFNKLEEVAIKRINKTNNRPLVLVINNSHLIKENEEGVKLIELLQQKAESLSGSGLVTMIFNSDDYWVYEKLKKLGTRLELINVRDFNREETVRALQFTREKFFSAKKYPDLRMDVSLCNKVYDLVGGRPQHVSQVARHRDVIKACHEIIDREKTWFLNQCGLLGADMDDDVMESGKFSTSAMLLMREFVDMDRDRLNTLISQDSPDPKDENKDHQLPELPLWRARQIMTRPDFIQQYDNLNVFTIDSESRVRADSVPMMRAFHEIASQPKFDELLGDTLERVADIESLGRTREVMLKDLNLGSDFNVSLVDGDYRLSLRKSDTHRDKTGELESLLDMDDDEDLLMEDINKKDSVKWWKRRMQGFDRSYLPPKPKTDIDIDRTN